MMLAKSVIWQRPPETAFPKGAVETDGVDALIRETRAQIGAGADWIKVYADYRWGPNGEARPTYTQAELELVVEVTESSGRRVVAHAATAEGMEREHGPVCERSIMVTAERTRPSP